MTVWSPVMFRNEMDMLACRLEATRDHNVQHVLVESTVTHLGVPKPLVLRDNLESPLGAQSHRVTIVTAELPDGAPWEREHAQRNAAWQVIDAYASDDDTVLICDCDEIPSAALLEYEPDPVASVRMRTCLFAVDWEVPQHLLPPTCVVARVGWLREQARFGMGLAQVRDDRERWPVIDGGGWHLSWLGGPEAQREKLDTASCHQAEIDATPEGALIRDGTRWATAQNGGGLPVVPVDVTDEWPSYVAQRRCPETWYRPR